MVGPALLGASGTASVVLAGALAIAAALDCTSEGDVAVEMAVIALVALAVGLGLRRRFALPVVIGPATVLSMMLTVFSVAVAWSTLVYLLTGAIGDPLHAFFESVAGFSTTASSVVPDPEKLPRGVLAWRSSTQWLGGLAAVIPLVGLLPELGVGAPEPGSGDQHDQPWRRANRHLQGLMRRLAAVYTALTVVGVALLAAAGLDVYDAFSVSLTTVSTGGLADHRGSIAHFHSASVEWVVLGGMAVSGAGIALFWRGLRGAASGFLRSTELRAYLAVLATSGGFAVVGTAPAGGPTHESVRHALFSVTSALTTTGHTVTDWTTWSPGLQGMLVALMAVGAMSGSAGGGFTVLRAVTMGGIVRREIVRQLDRNRVVIVKVGRQTIGESVLSRMVGFQVLSVLLVAGAAVALAATGVDLLGAGSGAVSSLSTVGPALGDLGPGRALDRASLGTQVVLIVMMTAGRLEIYPVVRAASGAGPALRRAIGRARRSGR